MERGKRVRLPIQTFVRGSSYGPPDPNSHFKSAWCTIATFAVSDHVQHTELCSTLCGSLDGRGAWGRLDTCMCVAECFPCSPGTISAFFIGYVVIQSLSCVRLCDPMDYSTPGSSVLHRLLGVCSNSRAQIQVGDAV